MPQFNLFSEGVCFPKTIINNILLTEVDKEKMAVEKNKVGVFDFIGKNKGAYLSEIANKFDLSIVETKLVLKELAEEGKIVLNK